MKTHLKLKKFNNKIMKKFLNKNLYLLNNYQNYKNSLKHLKIMKNNNKTCQKIHNIKFKI